MVEIIKTACEQGRWETYSARIAFLKSMLSHATGNHPAARQSLLTTLYLATKAQKQVHPHPSSSSSSTVAGAAAAAGVIRPGVMDELGVLAKACYVLLRLAEPGEQRRTDDVARSVAVDRLISELAPLAKTALPNVAMAIQVVLAMSCGEIVKAKSVPL